MFIFPVICQKILTNNFESIMMVNWTLDNTPRLVQPMGNADIRFIPVHDRTDSSQGFSFSDPKFYILGRDTLGLMPIPTSTVQSGLKIWYVYTPTELDSDSDEPDLPVKYHHIIKYGAYANYLDQDDEHTAAERMRFRFDTLAARMIERLEERQTYNASKSVEISQNQDLFVDTRSSRVII